MTRARPYLLPLTPTVPNPTVPANRRARPQLRRAASTGVQRARGTRWVNTQGGGPPSLPSNTTAGTVVSQWITWGNYGLVLNTPSAFETWKGWGFGGFQGGLSGSGYFSGFGGSQTMIGSDASALGSSYDWQKAYQGLFVSGITASSGRGLFQAKVNDSALYAGLIVRIADSTAPSTGAIGDIFNSTVRSNFCTQATLWAQGINYLGGNGLGIDLEYGNWGSISGHSDASVLTQYEQFGYEFGTAFWSTSGVGSLDLNIYQWPANGAWSTAATDSGATDPSAGAVSGGTDNRSAFVYGIMRAGAAAGATGRINFFDAWFYRGTQLAGATIQTALKWNSQGRRNIVSREVSQSTWNWASDHFFIEPFSWAGTDGTTGYNANQQGQPDYTDGLEQYRQWGEAGGVRAEFTLDGNGTPNGLNDSGTCVTLGLYAGNNNYTFPTGRLTALPGTVSTTPVSTSSPTFSNVSATGGVVSCRVSHAWGTKWIKVYSGAGFNPSSPDANFLGSAPLTWNINGGSETGGLSSDYMSGSFSTTTTAGTYFVLGTKTIKDDTAWTYVQAT